MKVKRLAYCVLAGGIFFLSACKEKYLPPSNQTTLNFLVVDGTLINGPDSTYIQLSRTKKLDDNSAIATEGGAQMTVEDVDGNALYNFTPVNNKGLYTVPGMNLDLNKKYRLRINTIDGNQYISDDVTVKATPPIDSVNWVKRENGVTIYTNTHDPLNNSKYYRWEYVETWDYTTYYFSQIKFAGLNPLLVVDSMFPRRNADEFVYHCWKTAKSSEILLGTSLKLSGDVISLAPVRFIPLNSFELNSIYSILVKQYSLSKESFEYFENLKRISEQTGSIFDAQPSELSGNIHNINNRDETVLGYVTASSLQQQRIFITKDQVRPWDFYLYCPDRRLVPIIADSLVLFFGGPSPLLTPTEKVVDLQGNVSGINGAQPACADCTSRGGVNIKPDFWP